MVGNSFDKYLRTKTMDSIQSFAIIEEEEEEEEEEAAAEEEEDEASDSSVEAVFNDASIQKGFK
jgi:CO dehydrogenase/acetyl-CoA synthase beta subunit